jgi:hypothetical protein
MSIMRIESSSPCKPKGLTSHQEVSFKDIKLNSLPVPPMLEAMYKLALEEPSLSVPEILKRLNVKDHAYKNFRRTNLGISEYRKAMLGMSRTITEEHKAKLMPNLLKSKGRPRKIDNSVQCS